MQKQILLATIITSLLVLTSCSSEYTYDDAKVIIGEKVVDVEIANNPSEWSAGMMNRKSLGKNQGMFFVFPEEKNRNFWMKNTLVPLDIIFIDARSEIINIHKAKPCKTDACDVYPSLAPAQFVLEVNRGFSEKNNIKEGMKIEVKY